MKIFITRKDARSIQVGGLGRLDVWFRKPVWIEPRYFTSQEHFFGEDPEIGCYRPQGWGVFDGAIQHPISFGAAFGYDSELSSFVWKNLCKHFNNVDFRKWDEYERVHPECNEKFFLLELELQIKFEVIKFCA